MKRALLALLLLAAIPAFAAEKWLEAYNRGVSLVRAGNFQAGAQALQHAVDEMPAENAAQRVRDQIFTYTPHFWLGIARLNLGDPDAALREWKVSEDQGAIQNTPYYAQLRDLIGRANSEKQRRAEGAATPSKQEANGAIGRALSAQRYLSRSATQTCRSVGRECESGHQCARVRTSGWISGRCAQPVRHGRG
jgi:hypothetical protein